MNKIRFSILGLREPLLMNMLEDEECDSKQHALVQYFIKVSIFRKMANEAMFSTILI